MPEFDYPAAKRAGYTDEQIAAFLRRKRAEGQDFYISRAAYDSTKVSAALPMMAPSQAPGGSYLDQLGKKAAEFLPTAGGFGGGMVGLAVGGPWAGIGMAGAGGAAGEAAKQKLLGKRISPADVAGQGLLQGGLEATGLGIGALATKAAGPLMAMALRPGALARRFPGVDIPEAALESRIPGIGRAGVAAASDIRRTAVRGVIGRLRAAQEAGTTFAAPDVTAEAARLTSKDVIGNVLARPERKAIGKQVKEFVTRYAPEQPPPSESVILDVRGKPFVTQPPPVPETKIPPLTLKRMKRMYQNRAKGTYRGTAEGMTVPGSQEFNRAMAAGTQRALETIPGVAEGEAAVQRAAAVQLAVEAAARRSPQMPNVIKPWTWPFLSMTPNMAERLAVKITDPGFQRLARQSPRFAAAVLNSMINSGAQPDATVQP